MNFRKLVSCPACLKSQDFEELDEKVAWNVRLEGIEERHEEVPLNKRARDAPARAGVRAPSRPPRRSEKA